MKRVRVEGWRFAYHSFALVNQWQMLSLLRRRDITLSFVDMPFLMPRWEAVRGVFDDEREDMIAGVPAPAVDEPPDVTYRIYTPYDFSIAEVGKTVVFATSEYQMMRASVVKPGVPLLQMRASESFSIVTPSRWSSECFRRWGLRDDQVHVVPLGVETAIFHPSMSRRDEVRRRLGLGSSEFLFGNFSGMAWNRGIDVLLHAFAIVVQKAPEARLLLKGAEQVYPSKAFFDKTRSSMPKWVLSAIEGKLIYTGAMVSMVDMADMYRALDAYVTPYRGEGFNLPPLEAVACGVPVICTKGGPTDEFMTSDIARFIDSELRSIPDEPVKNAYLEPEVDHLADLMLKMIGDDTWRKAVTSSGPAYVRERYSWDGVVEQLVAEVF